MASAARRKIPLARYPFAVELSYRIILRRLVDETRRVALLEINANAGAIIRRSKIHREDADSPEPSGWAAMLKALLLRIANGMTSGLLTALGRIGSISRQADGVNKSEFRKQVRAAYGVDILRNEPRLSDLLSAWEQENLALITSIPAQIVEQLRGRMTQAFVDGTSLRELTKIVRERTDVGEARGNLIARDQIGRLNGQLAEMRQRSIGVDEYIWRTSQDERVRPTHRVRDGKTYRWDAGGIRPGSEIRCRCNASPVFPDFADARLARTG